MAKINYSLELFPKNITKYLTEIYVQGCKNIPGLWICHGLQICLSSEYARVHNIMSILVLG